jgi:hypothetical protein
LSIFERDLARLAIGGLCSHFKEKIEGYDDSYISQLHIRALLQENKFKRAKECYKIHQSSTHVDCESITLDDEKKRNNSDMDNNSVMLETESNKDCSELTVSQGTSLAVQNDGKSSKIAILTFSKAECVVHFNSDYCIIEQHILAEKSLSSEETCIVKGQSNGSNKGSLVCQQKGISCNS